MCPASGHAGCLYVELSDHATAEDIYVDTFKNCVISNVGGTHDTAGDVTKFFPMGITLTPYNGTGDLTVSYTDFWGNGFPAFSGQGNMSVDPKFADQANADYHPKSTANSSTYPKLEITPGANASHGWAIYE